MNDFPLQAFFASLAQDGVVLSVRDYDRLLRAFETGGAWTVPRLRNTLTSLLARDEDQQRLIGRRFDGFFTPETGLERRVGAIDLERVRRELELPPPPPPPTPPQEPVKKPAVVKRAQKQERAFDEPPEKPVLVRRWLLAVFALVVLAGGVIGYLQYRPDEPPPVAVETPAPVCRLQPDALHFGTLPLNTSREIRFVIANAGNAELMVDRMALSPGRESFEAAFPDTPFSLQPGEEKDLAVTFAPETQGAFSAEIRVDHNAESNVDTARLDGKGATFGRAGKRVPYVHDVRIETIPPPHHWNLRIALTAVLFCVLLLCILYTWRLHSGPFVKKPKVDDKGRKFFHRGRIGGKPEPRLDEASLGLLADAMGYFQSERPGKTLDVPASVRATVRRGGIPACVFFTRKQIRTLLILEDADAEALEWNSIARELADGIGRYGVPVQYGRFRGTPERFQTMDGQVHYLEDLEDRRKGILLLIFTDGKGFHRPRNAFALEAVARWPMKAWMDPRDRRLWDDAILLAVRHHIPVHPATREGLFQAVGRFLTERGSADRTSEKQATEPWLPEWTKGREDVWVEHFLGDALPWAQDCAVMQPMPDGLADAIRREFHRALPPETIELAVRPAQHHAHRGGVLVRRRGSGGVEKGVSPAPGRRRAAKGRGVRSGPDRGSAAGGG